MPHKAIGSLASLAIGLRPLSLADITVNAAGFTGEGLPDLPLSDIPFTLETASLAIEEREDAAGSYYTAVVHLSVAKERQAVLTALEAFTEQHIFAVAKDRSGNVHLIGNQADAPARLRVAYELGEAVASTNRYQFRLECTSRKRPSINTTAESDPVGSVPTELFPQTTGGVAGVRQLWLADRDQVASNQLDETTLLSALAEEDFQQVPLTLETCGYQEEEAETAAGHTIRSRIRWASGKIFAGVRSLVENLAGREVIAVVFTFTGNVFLVGREGGLRMLTAYNTGAALADPHRYTGELTGEFPARSRALNLTENLPPLTGSALVIQEMTLLNATTATLTHPAGAEDRALWVNAIDGQGRSVAFEQAYDAATGTTTLTFSPAFTGTVYYF